jgi:polar amino acid transport system substrate-binding protein
MLDLGRIEIALWERRMGRAHARIHAMNDVRDLDPPLFIHEEFIYLHKRHAAHVAAISAALRAMKEDGTYQRASRERLFAYERDRPR